MKRRLSKDILYSRVNEIPLFEKRDMAVDRDGDWVEQDRWRGITEEDDDEVITPVSKRYNLVQIQDIFEEALDQIGDVRGNLYYHKGRGEMEVFPTEEDRETGLLIRNSVDKSLSIRVDFVTVVEGNHLILPEVSSMPDIEPYKRIHSCETAEVEFNNYFELLSDVEEAWDTIREELVGVWLDPSELEDIANDLALGKKFDNWVEKKLDDDDFAGIQFWQFVKKALRHISRDDYKSDIHHRKKVRRVSDKIMSESVLVAL